MPTDPPFKPHDGPLDQGDLIANVPLPRWEGGEIVGSSPKLCVVTSHECTCEDFERAKEKGKSAIERVLIKVAPLRAAKVFPEIVQEEIKEGKRLDLFYIYGDGRKMGDQVAVLAYEQAVPGAVLDELPTSARLADWQFARLQLHNVVSQLHRRPDELFREEFLKGEKGGG